jgi:hypothetical protein
MSFDKSELADIERLASGLSKAEVLDVFYMLEEELSQEDLDIFNRAYRKGRALAKAQAVDCLFVQMSGRQGVPGALAYLTRLADEWPSESEGNAGKTHSFSFDLTGGS